MGDDIYYTSVPTFSKADEPQTPEEKIVELGTQVDGNDDMAGYCVRGTCCGRVLEKP